MPVIKVEMFPGKSRDQKRAIVKELTDGMARATGGNPESVWVVINEVEKEDWGFGGVLGADKFPE